MEFSLAVYVVAPLVVFAGYTVFGIGGFGATIIIVPILAHFLPIKVVVPLCLYLDFSAAILLRARKGGVWWPKGEGGQELRWILPFMLTGMALGDNLQHPGAERWLMLALGCFVAGFALFNLLERAGTERRIGRHWGAPLGVLGGIGSSLFGTGGSVYALYIARRLPEPGAMRATMSAIIAISVLLRIPIFAVAGLLFKRELVYGWLGLFPLLVAGLVLGMRLHDKMNPAELKRVIYALLIVSGGSLAVRALALG
jgi:uncharacterized protein